MSLRKQHKELSMDSVLFKTNQTVLKLQIEEKRIRKDLERRENTASVNAGYFRAETTREILMNRLKQQRNTLNQDLQRQIREKQGNLRKLKEEHTSVEHSVLENAKRSLSEEQNNQERRKTQVNEDLKSSWDLAIKAKKLRNDIDQLRLTTMAGPCADKKHFKVYLPRNRSPADREQVLGKLKLLSQRERKIRREKDKILNSIRAKSSAKQNLSNLSRNQKGHQITY